MDQSENINELLTALAKAQGKIEGAVKCKTNPFHKSKYADLSSVWEACREPLASNGLSVIQNVLEIEGKLYLCTMIGHTSGQWIKSNIPMMLAKNDSQAMGSAITYARRYSLSAMIGIVGEDEDDDAEGNMKHQREIDKQKEKETKEKERQEKEELNKLIESFGEDKENFKQYSDKILSHYKEMTPRQFVKEFYEKREEKLKSFQLWKEKFAA